MRAWVNRGARGTSPARNPVDACQRPVAEQSQLRALDDRRRGRSASRRRRRNSRTCGVRNRGDHCANRGSGDFGGIPRQYWRFAPGDSEAPAEKEGQQCEGGRSERDAEPDSLAPNVAPLTRGPVSKGRIATVSTSRIGAGDVDRSLRVDSSFGLRIACSPRTSSRAANVFVPICVAVGRDGGRCSPGRGSVAIVGG